MEHLVLGTQHYTIRHRAALASDDHIQHGSVRNPMICETAEDTLMLTTSRTLGQVAQLASSGRRVGSIYGNGDYRYQTYDR